MKKLIATAEIDAKRLAVMMQQMEELKRKMQLADEEKDKVEKKIEELEKSNDITGMMKEIQTLRDEQVGERKLFL